jgi:hypothetical protein
MDIPYQSAVFRLFYFISNQTLKSIMDYLKINDKFVLYIHGNAPFE